MRDSTHLPNLQMLPVDKLVLHETCDERRVAKLCQRLRRERRLKNPPIVTPFAEQDCYIVLDGANRVSAFHELKIPHIVAQIVSYDDPGVELETWYHVVAGMSETIFVAALDAISNLHLTPVTLEEARRRLAIDDGVAYLVSRDAVHLVHNTADGNDIGLLNNLVGAYKGKANIYRASNDDFAKQAPTYPDITALVIFPRYRPADLVALVRRGEVVPSGITRHVIPERALRVNIPLDVLESSQPLAEKQAWMQQWWRERLSANAIRFYAESTFLFDE